MEYFNRGDMTCNIDGYVAPTDIGFTHMLYNFYRERRSLPSDLLNIRTLQGSINPKYLKAFENIEGALSGRKRASFRDWKLQLVPINMIKYQINSIDLKDNKLSSLPPELGDNKLLFGLNLMGNGELSYLPDSLINCNYLYYLLLSETNIEGAHNFDTIKSIKNS